MDMNDKPVFGYWFGFGSWRLLLAILVALSHLWSGMIDGFAAYAVWGFFVLSGYLMTYVLRNKYGFEAPGLRAYAYNRFIRIMPTYYLAAVVGVVTIIALKNCVDLTRLNPQFAMPHGRQWLNPLTLLPVFTGSNLPVPVSGALATEVGMYLLMPFMARSRTSAWLALILGVVANATIGFDVHSFPARYTHFETCLFAFAAGSLTGHYIDSLRRFAWPAVALIVWVVHGLIWLKWDQWPWRYGLYSSVLLSAWVVVSLDVRRNSALDKLLGDWSYPVYLFHTVVAAWLLPWFGYGRPLNFFLLAFVLTIAVSWLVVVVLDRPLARLKRPGLRVLSAEKDNPPPL
jgi:peptidoglycan/LPS O-acetylase OafA/YrhL